MPPLTLCCFTPIGRIALRVRPSDAISNCGTRSTGLLPSGTSTGQISAIVAACSRGVPPRMPLSANLAFALLVFIGTICRLTVS